MSLVTRSGDVGDRRMTGEMNMKCAAETFSAPLEFGSRRSGAPKATGAGRGHAVENACP